MNSARYQETTGNWIENEQEVILPSFSGNVKRSDSTQSVLRSLYVWQLNIVTVAIVLGNLERPDFMDFFLFWKNK